MKDDLCSSNSEVMVWYLVARHSARVLVPVKFWCLLPALRTWKYSKTTYGFVSLNAGFSLRSRLSTLLRVTFEIMTLFHTFDPNVTPGGMLRWGLTPYQRFFLSLIWLFRRRSSLGLSGFCEFGNGLFLELNENVVRTFSIQFFTTTGHGLVFRNYSDDVVLRIFQLRDGVICSQISLCFN